LQQRKHPHFAVTAARSTETKPLSLLNCCN
jgi:hypothetical protein